jgi:hypothetical protein
VVIGRRCDEPKGSCGIALRCKRGYRKLHWLSSVFQRDTPRAAHGCFRQPGSTKEMRHRLAMEDRGRKEKKELPAGRGEGSVVGLQLRVRFVPAALLAMLRTELATPVCFYSQGLDRSCI